MKSYIKTSSGAVILVACFLLAILLASRYPTKLELVSRLIAPRVQPAQAALDGSGSGLVGWWKFDEGSGTTANDSSGNGYAGTLIHNFPSDNSAWVTGQIGNALSFGAVSDSSTVLVNNALVSDVSDGSYSLWVYELDSSPNSSYQILLDAKGASWASCYGLKYVNGVIEYMWQNNPPSFHSGIYTYDLSSKWTHISVTWNDTDAYLYINGSLVQAGPRLTCYLTLGTNFSIGNIIYNGSGTTMDQNVHGYLDDVRVYNRKLSAQDVYFLYKLNTWGNTPAINHAPIVYVGSNQTITLPASATLSGATIDDGLPVESSLTTTWSMVSGPAQAYFTAASSLDTDAVFSTSGTYVLRLTASDSDLASTSDVTITVNPADVTPPVLSNSYPTYQLSASTTQTDFWVTTDEKAVCKYGTTPGVAYASQANNFDYDNGITHRKLLTGLSAGNSYTYYVRCRDTAVALNTNSSDYTVAFSIAQATTSSRSLYVATTGSSGGNGSIGSPWNLTTALNSNLSHARAGDTIWLRGGTYDGIFASTLLGSTTGQITVRSYPGEWAVIDGYLGQSFGGYTTFRDFEITGSSTAKRVSSQTGSRPTDVWNQGGVEAGGSGNTPGMKFINLVVHDTIGDGFGLWSNGPDLEAYGNIIYHNGWDASDRGHGHGIYTQNNTGIKMLADNIAFGNLGGFGIKVYTEGGTMYNYDLDGNIIFQNNLLVGGLTAVKNVQITNNYVQFSNQYNSSYDYQADVVSNYIGYNNDAVMNFDAYMYGNRTDSASIFHWNNIIILANKFFGDFTLSLSPENSLDGYNIDNNQYYTGLHTIYNSNGSEVITLPAWQSLGLDTSSTYSASNPTGEDVIIRPNKYESGRANIIVYNWNQANTVNVDLSSVLNPGDSYEIRDVQNYFGTPISSGIYAGGTVSVSMTGITMPSFIGDFTGAYHTILATHTSSAFGAFVLIKTASGGVTPPAPVSASCSAILNTCTTGTFSDTADTSTQYLWNCAGSNGGTTASCSLNIPLAPDTTSPIISISLPVNNSTLTGSVSLSAAASDPIVTGQTTSGIQTVQFKLDGANLGSALTTSPYSGSWNTIGVSNGAHILTAAARDAAGNTKTSVNITITVSNNNITVTPPPGGGGSGGGTTPTNPATATATPTTASSTPTTGTFTPTVEQKPLVTSTPALINPLNPPLQGGQSALVNFPITNNAMYERLKGKIILRIQSHGEAYYISPKEKKMYYLGRPADAFQVMRSQGLGITNANLNKIPVSLKVLSGLDTDLDGLPDAFEDALGTSPSQADTDSDSFNDKSELATGYSPLEKNKKLSFDNALALKFKGRILLQVESHGEAWYINPADGQRYFLARPTDAFNIMRRLGLGMTDKDYGAMGGK